MTALTPSESTNTELIDHVSRVKRPSPLGTTIFIILNILDACLQYAFLQLGWMNMVIGYLGLRTIPSSADSLILFKFMDVPITHSMILVLMPTCTAIKSIYAILFIAEQEMPTTNALILGPIITAYDTINTCFYTIAVLTASRTSLIVGTALYIIGLSTETISEIQRRKFKDKSVNKGKVFSGGLFSLARHVNYGSFTLWRAGYAMAASGVWWGVIVGMFVFDDFRVRGVPVLDQYCQKKVRLDADKPD